MKEGCCGTPDVTDAQYGPAGELTQVTYGGTTEARSYNILGQLTGISYNGTLRHEYRYSATANDGRLTSHKNWQSGEDVQYQYDSLARLTSAQTVGPEWGQSFGYDGFGNLLSKAVTKGTATVLSVTADPATNRISGLSYDANGNVTNLSGVGTMSYDGRNRFVGDTSTGQLPTRGYDPSNRKIWSFTGAGDFQFDFYSPIGQKLGTYRVYWPVGVTGAATIVQITEYKYFGGRVIRVNGPSGAIYPMEDRLGSTVPHLPYGDEINPTAQDRVKFATYHRESSGVLDYAMNRYYSPVYGRFTSPDPYRASGGPANPGSWNRYVYVGGDPTNFLDPWGLASCPAGSTTCVDVTDKAIPVPYDPGYWSGGITNPGPPPDWWQHQQLIESGGCYNVATGQSCYEEDVEKEEYAKALQRATNCITNAVGNHYGLTAAGVASTLLGPIPKSAVPPFRSIGSPSTTILSVIGQYINIQVPRIVFGGLGTTNLLRAAGRMIAPVAGPIGWSLLAIDAALSAVSSIDCYQNQQAAGTP